MSGVTFERLPPERRVAAPAAASAGSCCCCCCCCLHTVGSLLGALTAKPPQQPDTTVPTAVVGTDKIEPNYKVTREYWVTLLILCTVVVPIVAYAGDMRIKDPAEWALLYALVLPVVQLGASLVVGVRNGFSKRPGRDERLRHLGSITIRSFIGGCIGILVMLVLFTTLK